MAAAVGITVFAGFARTYYLRPMFSPSLAPPLTPLLHLHGLVFSSWILLFITQTTLVAANRTRVHRRLGIAGMVLAALLVTVGISTAIIRTAHGMTTIPGGLVFLVVPLGDMVVFSILAGAAFYYRRRPDMHKRLILLATIAMLPAAVARLPFALMQTGPLAFFGFADLFILPCVVYDLVAFGKIHRATLFGALLIIASQPLRLAIGGTQAWLDFATWLTGLVS
jgi:hypothetical protein